jgi:hypothetical protein
VAVAGFVTVGLAVAAGVFAVRLLVVLGVDDDEELAAAAMPMTTTSPHNPSKAVSTLCLAGQGLRPCGPPGGPYPCSGCQPQFWPSVISVPLPKRRGSALRFPN